MEVYKRSRERRRRRSGAEVVVQLLVIGSNFFCEREDASGLSLGLRRSNAGELESSCTFPSAASPSTQPGCIISCPAKASSLALLAAYNGPRSGSRKRELMDKAYSVARGSLLSTPYRVLLPAAEAPGARPSVAAPKTRFGARPSTHRFVRWDGKML